MDKSELTGLIEQAIIDAVKANPELLPLLNEIAAKIADEGVAWHQKFKPYDKPYQDNDEDWDDWEITEEDIDRAVKRWDEVMPEYAGMLDAKVEIDENAG